METKRQSTDFLKQRKFLLIAPILVLPFVTLAFWSMGGGKVTTPVKDSTGINLDLPGANVKEDEAKDKMSYYDQAGVDSTKLNELKKNDPYYNYHLLGDSSFSDTDDFEKGLSEEELALVLQHPKHGGIKGLEDPDDNEKRIYEKLNRLNVALTKSSGVENYEQSSSPDYTAKDAEIERLQQMLSETNQTTEKDPEMEQLNGMLEKLVDVQNPSLVQEKIRQASEKRKGQVFAITTGKKTVIASSLDRPALNDNENGNGFYSYEENDIAITDSQNAVQAVIHQTQTLANGATVKLRLTDDIYINGVLIPKQTFVYGLASLNGERLNVKVNSIRYKNNLFPVELTVYDLDGLDGIYIPGAIGREVAKESTDRGLQDIGLNSLDPSIGMQAAGVGIEAAKSFLSKKVKLIRVTVKAGYHVLLKDEKIRTMNN